MLTSATVLVTCLYTRMLLRRSEEYCWLNVYKSESIIRINTGYEKNR